MTKTQFVDSILNDKNCRFYSRIVLSTQTRNQHSGRSMTFCEIHAPIFVKMGLTEEEKKCRRINQWDTETDMRTTDTTKRVTETTIFLEIICQFFRKIHFQKKPDKCLDRK